MEDTLRDYGTDFGYDTVLAGLALRWFRKPRFDQSVGDFFGRFLVTALFVIVHNVAEQLRSSHVFDRVMKAGELCGCRLPDIRNRQGKKPPRERQGSRALDRLDRLGGVFLAKNARRFLCAKIQFRELLDFQVEKIQRFAHEAALNKFVRDNSADAFDVERAARAEEFHAPRRLCRAIQIFAAPRDKFRVAPDGTAPRGTFPVNVFGEIERLRVSWPLRFHNFTHGGNDFARLFDHHGVADANVFAFDFVFVVQGRTGDGASAHQHRFKHSNRRQDSGASNLNDDVLQAGLDTFRRVFVSDRPPRRFRG